MNVVVVESPAKAKTINRYLGKDYTVLASYGHVRDLPSKDGAVRPEDGFAMDWQTDQRGQKQVRAIAQALKGASNLYLATDPDREGEAISWHVREMLTRSKDLVGVDVKRVVFNEVTKDAVLEAFSHPRELDQELINAYLARRALDYLVGFTLSPVLWRKLPGSRSAGRVQSVALRLICERETEIESFVAREYWTIKAQFDTDKEESFEAFLTHLNGVKLERYDLNDEAVALAAASKLDGTGFSVSGVERKRTRRNPSPPFTTSTLQQEASRKLQFGARRTMSVAQRLYEGIDLGGDTVGLITYMRTDGVQMAREAITDVRGLISRDFGDGYLPETPRVYKTKAKNAQEAHEAIRPTDVSRHPSKMSAYLDRDHARLYALIWQRTVASQMASALVDQVAVDVIADHRGAQLRATGSVIAFDGFLKLYQEGKDDAKENGESRRLPDVNEGNRLRRGEVTPEQHFTQPPPRYSEASLVKRLEELGIGRPSTYATIISVLQERDYVLLDRRRFVPVDRGRLVTAFLTSFFERYVAYDFTARLEEQLDDISGGRVAWKDLLQEFWQAFKAAVDETKDLRITEVLDALNDLLGPHFFREDGSGRNPRACPSCTDGLLSLKLGKFGAFIGCSTYPDCRYTRRLAVPQGDGKEGVEDGAPKILGTDPDSGQPVSLRHGPYGHYVQLGEGVGSEKPRRASLPRGAEPETVDLERALAYLSLPRDMGTHPETGEPIIAGIGRFGPYIRHQDTYVSLRQDDVLTIGLNRAVALIADKPRRPAGRDLGAHPADGKPVALKSGRYGPYVEHAGLRATLPKGQDGDSLSMERAVEILEAKKARGGGKGGPKGARAKTAKANTTKPKTAKPKTAKPRKTPAKKSRANGSEPG